MIQPAKALDIARINLLRQIRDRADLFFVFVLPTIIIVALGLQFGGPSRARLGVVVPSGDAAAAELVTLLQADPTRFDVRQIATVEQLREQVERGQLEAGVVVPDGFAGALAGSGTAEVGYLGTTDSLTLGLRAPVEAAVTRLGTVATAARIALTEGAAPDWTTAERIAAGMVDDIPGVTVVVSQVGEVGMFSGFSAGRSRRARRRPRCSRPCRSSRRTAGSCAGSATCTARGRPPPTACPRSRCCSPWGS